MFKKAISLHNDDNETMYTYNRLHSNAVYDILGFVITKPSNTNPTKNKTDTNISTWFVLPRFHRTYTYYDNWT